MCKWNAIQYKGTRSLRPLIEADYIHPLTHSPTDPSDYLHSVLAFGEDFGEEVTGAEELGLYGAEGHVEYFGDLFIG